MDAETGEALKGADGKDITASAKFTPQAQDGSQDVTFTFDASALGGAKTVVFEKLFVDGTLIARTKTRPTRTRRSRSPRASRPLRPRSRAARS